MDTLSIKLDNLRKKYIEEGKHEVALGLAVALGESEILVPKIIEVHREEAYHMGYNDGSISTASDCSSERDDAYAVGYDEGFATGYNEGYHDGGQFNR